MNNDTHINNQRSKTLLFGLKSLREALNSLSLEQFVVNTLEMLMFLERDEYLATLKKSGEIKDKGNGTYPRSFKSLSRNALVINIPRTRYTEFKPLVLEFLKYSEAQINELVLTLYRKGLTTRDISSILKEFFGEEMSYAKVSDLAENFHDIRQAWEQMTLQTYYKVVYGDALYITLRRGASYAKEAVHILYGVREDNKRELLALAVYASESKETWSECLKGLKKRGVQNIDLVVADGLKGLEDEVHKHFPGTVFQKCVLHKMRNLLNKVRPKHKQQVSLDLKEVFNNFDSNSSVEKAMKKLGQFINKWQIYYPSFKRIFSEDTTEYYFNYISYPAEVRRMIYTTNSIENLNKRIRKATKNKQSFEKPERLLDYIFIIIKDFECDNWMKYPVSTFTGWNKKTQLD